MTRIVRRPVGSDLLRLSQEFDRLRSKDPTLSLTEFCEQNSLPYQTLRTFRAVAVKKGIAIFHARPKRKVRANGVDAVEPQEMDSFDHQAKLDAAYMLIGRLVVEIVTKGGKIL